MLENVTRCHDLQLKWLRLDVRGEINFFVRVGGIEAPAVATKSAIS